MDLRDGHQHHHDQPEGRRPHQESHDHRKTAEALDDRGDGRGGGRDAHLPEPGDGRRQSPPAEPAERLLGAVGEEDDAQRDPNHQMRPRRKRAEHELDEVCHDSSPPVAMGTAASYPRVVKRVSLYARRSARVYYMVCGVPLLLVVLALGAPSAPAQVELTAHPSMIKGPPGAPVTIIEFSDYQCPHCKAV